MTLLDRQGGGRAGHPVRALPPASHLATLNLLLLSGGDERLLLDPHTGRNKYGTCPTPAPADIWFSSSTASTITPRGYAAAGRAMAALFADMPGDRLDLAPWFASLRARLLALYGVPGAEVVLAGSGTELELLSLALARAGDANVPLTNIIIAPGETGSGVPLAAEGRHFLATSSLSGTFVHRARLQDWETAAIQVETIAIRVADGTLRPAGEVDAEAECVARTALARGDRVLLHVLDASKTGRMGVSRAAARQIQALDPARVTVVVDACQLRCDAQDIKSDVAHGFMVMVTGSKFAGGPPFSGALVLPADRVSQAAALLRLPQGLAAYSAALDWPAPMRACGESVFTTPANLGLGLRWEAALSELEAYAAVPRRERDTIQTAFGCEVLARVAARNGFEVLDGPRFCDPDGRLRTLYALGFAQAASLRAVTLLHRAMQQAQPGLPACHLGQMVPVGEAGVLRLCLSAPHITQVAERLAQGLSLDTAMAPLRQDLDVVFARLDALLPTLMDVM